MIMAGTELSPNTYVNICIGINSRGTTLVTTLVTLVTTLVTIGSDMAGTFVNQQVRSLSQTDLERSGSA